MEVNKEEAARCRTLGAEALRHGQYARAAKMFQKSLHLYPLPGVQALLEQAERKLSSSSSSSSASQESESQAAAPQPQSSFANNNAASSASRSSSSSSLGADGRTYTAAQVAVVNQVLQSKNDGRQNVHYRVLGIPATADDAAIKKAYRQLALKLHPDKNSAPHADEAFKAVGLAYATLSDPQKRKIYDLSGEEDPDNRGGGGGGVRRGPQFNGQEVSPEDIFNMFFGGGMPPGMAGARGAGPGFRVYSTGFGPGMAFGGMHPQNMRARQQRQQQQQQQQQPVEGILGTISQLLPLILILLFSFFNMGANDNTGASTGGGNRYFSLTPVSPHTNLLTTKITKVKDIPFYVSDQFIRTIARDKYQLSQVERMVERGYQTYLLEECKNQKTYKRRLEKRATSTTQKMTEKERANLAKKADEFVLSRCFELEDLFPESVAEKDRVKRRHSEF